MILSVLSSPGLMVARAKNPVHSVLFLFLFLRVLFFIAFSHFSQELGSVLMEDLYRAVAQFYPAASGGVSGGFPIPPNPEGAGAPLLIEIPDQPGPPEAEGVGVGRRDWRIELDQIQKLEGDTSLSKSCRNCFIKQEEIIIQVKKLIPPDPKISDDDIRNGVDAFLTPYKDFSKERSYAVKKMSHIKIDLAGRGSASTYFDAIVKEIESITGP